MLSRGAPESDFQGATTPARPGGPKMRAPVAGACGGLKNQDFIQRNEV